MSQDSKVRDWNSIKKFGMRFCLLPVSTLRGFVVIDASRSQDAITADIRQTVLARLTAAGLLDGVDVNG